MDRKKFLSLTGLGMGSLVVASCIGACSKDSASSTSGSTFTPVSADLTLDLTNASYSKLLSTKGSFVTLSQGIIVAYGIDGNYYAVQSICPHESGALIYSPSGNNFPCTKHDTVFSKLGISNGAQTQTNLKTYTVSVSGTTMTIKG